MSVPRPRPGTVVLVGGGPGDPELITVAGLRAVQEAEVVVHDRLAPLSLLDELRPEVEVVDVGKWPGGPAARQEEINRLIVDRALAGKAVVRLKGGDPFVFARGGEEVEACAQAGVPCAVIPGVSSATGVPALHGIPLTQRGLAQELVIVAGHLPPGDPRSLVDWAALGGSNATVVLLMGMDNLPAIVTALLGGGRDPATPTVCIQDGSLPTERSVSAPLEELPDAIQRNGLGSPAVVVIGAVAARSKPNG